MLFSDDLPFFIVTGAKFDENGNLRNWWSNHSLGEFEKRSECMADEYSEYSVQKRKVSTLQLCLPFLFNFYPRDGGQT